MWYNPRTTAVVHGYNGTGYFQYGGRSKNLEGPVVIDGHTSKEEGFASITAKMTPLDIPRSAGLGRLLYAT